MKKVLLTEEHFRALVSGEIVNVGGVDVALQDIGWFNMIDIIEDVVLKRVKEEQKTEA